MGRPKDGNVELCRLTFVINKLETLQNNDFKTIFKYLKKMEYFL